MTTFMTFGPDQLEDFNVPHGKAIITTQLDDATLRALVRATTIGNNFCTTYSGQDELDRQVRAYGYKVYSLEDLLLSYKGLSNAKEL